MRNCTVVQDLQWIYITIPLEGIFFFGEQITNLFLGHDLMLIVHHVSMISRNIIMPQSYSYCTVCDKHHSERQHIRQENDCYVIPKQEKGRRKRRKAKCE